MIIYSGLNINSLFLMIWNIIGKEIQFEHQNTIGFLNNEIDTIALFSYQFRWMRILLLYIFVLQCEFHLSKMSEGWL